MTQAGLYAASREMIETGYSRDYLRRCGLDDAELRLIRSGEMFAIQLRCEGMRFVQRLDDLDFAGTNAGEIAHLMDRRLIGLTSRARHYLRRTPRCYRMET